MQYAVGYVQSCLMVIHPLRLVRASVLIAYGMHPSLLFLRTVRSRSCCRPRDSLIFVRLFYGNVRTYVVFIPQQHSLVWLLTRRALPRNPFARGLLLLNIAVA